MEPDYRSNLKDSKSMKVLVIAPHPDDETLGCGGTLLKHKAAGDKLFWLIATKAYQPEWSAETIQNKEIEINAVAAAYDFAKVFRADLPTARLDTVGQAEIIAQLRKVIHEVAPDCVYVNHAGDIHSDHRVIFEGCASALKPFHTSIHGVKRLLSYETLSSTDAAPPLAGTSFNPNVFCDVTAFIERKLEIMCLYASEIHPSPMPRAKESIRALARFRGATIAAEYAEAFMLIRELT